MWTLKGLIDHSNSCHVNLDEKWVPARPINWKHRTFKHKLQEAWAVYSGKAEAFTWPENQ